MTDGLLLTFSISKDYFGPVLLLALALLCLCGSDFFWVVLLFGTNSARAFLLAFGMTSCASVFSVCLYFVFFVASASFVLIGYYVLCETKL